MNQQKIGSTLFVVFALALVGCNSSDNNTAAPASPKQQPAQSGDLIDNAEAQSFFGQWVDTNFQPNGFTLDHASRSGTIDRNIGTGQGRDTCHFRNAIHGLALNAVKTPEEKTQFDGAAYVLTYSQDQRVLADDSGNASYCAKWVADQNEQFPMASEGKIYLKLNGESLEAYVPNTSGAFELSTYSRQ